MKHKGERCTRWGEGGLAAVALLLVLAFSLLSCLSGTPRTEMILPIHDVDFDVLRTAEMVNINADSVEKLSRLPGIGEVLARRIVAYREAHGPFASVEELLKVEGLGERKLNGIRSEIYVG